MPRDLRLRVRRARASDREPLMAMSSLIWGGSDYLPLVWDKWLADDKGVLLTATLDGVPVGVSKVSLLAPGEVWLEGLRLHPDLHGRGLVKQINRVAFREAMRLEPTSIRYSTGAGNAASRHLGELRGFWMVARANWLWGKSLPEGPLTGRKAETSEAAEVRRYVRGSECFTASGGLCPRGWKFPALTGRRLRSLLGQGRVLVVRNRKAIIGVAIYDIGEIDGDVCLGYLDGPDEVMVGLATDVRRVARSMGQDDSSAMLPVGRIADVARESGYDLIVPADAVVYELGARGFSDAGESFESAMWRTLRANSSRAADALTDLLVERAPCVPQRENARDFVMRNLLPDTLRETYSAIESVQYRLTGWPMRAILRGVVRHFMNEYGIAGDMVRTSERSLSLWFGGRRLAVMRIGKRSLTLTLGPGFGPCFSPGAKFQVESVSLPKSAFDEASGRYTAISLKLSDEQHVPGATRAIDAFMKHVPGCGKLG